MLVRLPLPNDVLEKMIIYVIGRNPVTETKYSTYINHLFENVVYLINLKKLRNLAFVNKQFYSVVKNNFWKKDNETKLNYLNNLAQLKLGLIVRLNLYKEAFKIENDSAFFLFKDNKQLTHFFELKKEIEKLDSDFRRTGDVLIALGKELEYAQNKKIKPYNDTLKGMIEAVLKNLDQSSMDLLAYYMSGKASDPLIEVMSKENKISFTHKIYLKGNLIPPLYDPERGETAKYLTKK